MWIKEFFTNNIATSIGFIATIFSAIIVVFNIRAIGKQNETVVKSARDERFKNAIEQLGSEKNAVVLGGIYTLHRIAKEDETYRENVFNILCSYVRDTTTTKEYKEKYEDKPSEPIQTILNILCVNVNDREIYRVRRKFKKERFIIDFSEAYLAGCNLDNSYFPENSNLYKVYFNNSIIIASTLVNVNLQEARLEYVKAYGINLTKSNLYEAKLIHANLSEAKLIKTDLCGADLSYVHLDESKIIGSNLKDTNLEYTILEKAYISFSELQGAKIEGSRFTNAYIYFSDLSNIKLNRISNNSCYQDGITGINLSGTEIIATKLWRADFRNSNLSNTKIVSVYSCSMDTFCQDTNEDLSSKFEKQTNYCVGKETDLSGILNYNPNDPQFSDINTEILTQEEADKIIADYKKAVGEI